MRISDNEIKKLQHGHYAIVDDIERSVLGRVQDPRQHAWPKIRLRMRDHTPLGEVAHTLFSAYRRRGFRV